MIEMLRTHYPLVLIVIGTIILLFPFVLIDGSMFTFYAVLISGSTAIITGFLLYYMKRTSYTDSLRKKMKIVAIVFLIALIAAPVTGVILGVLLGFGIIEPSPHEDTRTVNHDLLQHQVVNWVNVNRIENGVKEVTMDHNLNRLSYLRSTDMSSVFYDQAEIISNLNVTEIAVSNNLECIINDGPVSIYEYVLVIPHTKFRTIDELVNFGMTFLIEQENEKENIFASNMTRTGISVSANDDHLFVVQTFC